MSIPQLSRLSCLPVAIVLGVVFAAPVQADGMSCGSALVHDGDEQARVRRVCGEPSQVEKRYIRRRPQVWLGGRLVYVGQDEVDVPVEIWTYNFGPNKLMRRLRIVDGLVEEIETLGYGHHQK